MSESMRMWVEVIFNVCYLLVVWGMVVLMANRQDQVAAESRPLAKRIMWAFALLALGDTGHVGFRVVAYALGGLESNEVLVGLGSLSTAYTVTVFYMLMVDAWRLRYKQALGWFGWFLLAVGVGRMLVMLFPQNGWWQLNSPYEWSLIRNAFLTVQGLGVMALIFRDASRAKDRPFLGIAGMIAASYTFYFPVILWAVQIPMLGMLMIPKTLAYLGVAFIAYRALYQKSTAQALQPAIAD